MSDGGSMRVHWVRKSVGVRKDAVSIWPRYVNIIRMVSTLAHGIRVGVVGR